MAKLKIIGTKAILNEVAFREKCEEHASQMKSNAIRYAPRRTGLLKESGIKKENTDAGSTVFLDTDSVEYGLYQELGWKDRSGQKHPGKFFMEKAFQLECAKAGIDSKKLMRDAVSVAGSNGYDIVEYRRIKTGTVRKRAYKK
jgi:hypothetical protein